LTTALPSSQYPRPTSGQPDAMPISAHPNLLTDARVACGATVSSKKKALQLLAELLAQAVQVDSDDDEEDVDGELQVLDALAAREKLGCTGMGHGVAIPHGRVDFVDEPVGAVAILSEPIPFDAPDEKDVDILFGLLMPAQQVDEHLEILASLAAYFNQAENRDALRSAADSHSVLHMLADTG